VQTTSMLLGIGLFTVVAYGDVRTRRIPNELAFGIGGLGLFRMIMAGDLSAALCTGSAAAAVFGLGFLLFRRGLVGGGDVKLVTAAALLVGYHDLLGFLILMSLGGGGLALAVLAEDRFRTWLRSIAHRAAIPAFQADHGISGRPSVPYGVAIAAAAVLILVLQSSGPG
jgi:prepilin peptidase CpaA